MIIALGGYHDYVNCGPGVDHIYVDDTKDYKDTVFLVHKYCEFINEVDTREK